MFKGVWFILGEKRTYGRAHVRLAGEDVGVDAARRQAALALGRKLQLLHLGIIWSGIVEFVQSPVVAAALFFGVSPEGDDVDDGLRVLLLVFLRDAVIRECSLPSLG